MEHLGKCPETFQGGAEHEMRAACFISTSKRETGTLSGY